MDVPGSDTVSFFYFEKTKRWCHSVGIHTAQKVVGALIGFWFV
jgi:hypothetical protein